jgi:molybdenum cofactor biosynthesis enzyme MoaA
MIWAEHGNEGIRVAAGNSPAIRTGAVNHLVLRCSPVGEGVSLSVNGHRVARVSNDYADGAFTRVLLSVEATRRLADAQFDNVVVRKP